MRLTKQLKADLLKAVMEDQFKAEIDANNKAIREKARAAIKARYADFNKDLKELAEKHNVDINLLGSTPNDRMHIKTVIESGLYIHAFGTNRYSSNLLLVAKCDAFEAGAHVPKEKMYSDMYFTPTELGVAKLVQKQDKLFEHAREIHKDLVAVLMSVTTVKKLQELTNVFDPFIPKEGASTAMIPAESLCRVNELKSPKAKTKA